MTPTSVATAKDESYVHKAACVVVKLALWATLLFWLALWPLRLFPEWKSLNAPVTRQTDWRGVYGTSAGYFLLFDAPVFAIVVLAAVYLEIQPSPASLAQQRSTGTFGLKIKRGQLRANLWTYPVFTRGPLGIVTAAELLGLLTFLTVLLLTIAFHWKYEFEGVAPTDDSKTWQTRLDSAGHKTGHTALLLMAFLFFPVTRGSVLLRLINVPFDQAVKYHKWLANIMLMLVLAHGFICAAYMHTVKHNLWSLMGKWNRVEEFNNLAGCIAALAGVVMWFTSLPGFRRRNFEIFYFAHHLYIVFVIFTAIHVGEKMFNLAMAGVFLFALDRFLRFIQSRRGVSLISLRDFPGEAVELVLAKHPGLQYSPGSFIFVQVPAISWWEWHPFTITSSPTADLHHVSIIVKGVTTKGAWTHQLKKLVRQRAVLNDPCSAVTSFGLPRVSVEGPYGNQFGFFHRYENLIMVAGGSGVTPFISILKDILHTHHKKQQQQQPFLPADVTLVWAVRKADELHALTDRLTLPLDHEQGLSLHLRAFVTHQDQADGPSAETDLFFALKPECSTQESQSPLRREARDSNWGVITTVLTSVACYLCIWGLFAHYCTEPLHQQGRKPYPAWASTLFRMLSMALAISMAGGGSALLWSFLENTTCCSGTKQPSLQEKSTESLRIANMLDKPVANITYGHRPNLEEIFNEAAKHLEGTNVGVMVCGPFEMQQDVARQCRKHSSLFGSSTAFHFHSDSFHL